MLAAVGTAWALFLGIGLMMLGNGLQGSLLGIRASLEGFATITTGLIMTGYFAGFLMGSVMGPRIVRRVGHIRAFAALASMASTSVLLHTVFLDAPTWVAMRVVTGFCYAGLYVVAESWLNHQATNETRGQLLSIYMVITYGGVGGGQFLLNLADPGGFQLFILVSVLVSLAVVPMLLSVQPQPTIEAPQPISLFGLYRISPLGVVSAFGTGIANGGLFGMGAVYAREAGYPVSEIALFMAAATFGGVALQWPIGRLSDRFDRRLVLTSVTLGAALAAYLAVSVTGTLAPALPGWSIFAVAALFGGLSLPMYSLGIAHTNDFLTPQQMVAASGGLLLVGGLGAILGPLAVSGVMQFVGPTGFFWALGTVHGLIGAFAIYRMMARRARPLAQQGAFVAYPRTSPMAATLTPETEPTEPGPATEDSADFLARDRDNG